MRQVFCDWRDLGVACRVRRRPKLIWVREAEIVFEIQVATTRESSSALGHGPLRSATG